MIETSEKYGSGGDYEGFSVSMLRVRIIEDLNKNTTWKNVYKGSDFKKGVQARSAHGANRE